MKLTVFVTFAALTCSLAQASDEIFEPTVPGGPGAMIARAIADALATGNTSGAKITINRDPLTREGCAAGSILIGADEDLNKGRSLTIVNLGDNVCVKK